jgi:hypothetical protein
LSSNIHLPLIEDGRILADSYLNNEIIKLKILSILASNYTKVAPTTY